MARTCTCGDVEDEHGPEPGAPRGQACHAERDGERCDCIHFEWDGESDA